MLRRFGTSAALVPHSLSASRRRSVGDLLAQRPCEAMAAEQAAWSSMDPLGRRVSRAHLGRRLSDEGAIWRRGLTLVHATTRSTDASLSTTTFVLWTKTRYVDSGLGRENLSDLVGRFLGMTAIEDTGTPGAGDATGVLEHVSPWSSTERRRSDMETRPDAGSRSLATDVCADFNRRFRYVDGNPAMWIVMRAARTCRSGSVGFLV